MKYYIVSLLLIHILSCMAYAQSGKGEATVRGQVVDNSTLSPIPYVTLSVLHENESFCKGAVADVNGKFFLQLPDSTRYILEVSCVGYKSLRKVVSTVNLHSDIGQVRLEEESIQLSEVAITARKERIKLSASGLTYDMKHDPLSQSENLLFALRNVPLVTVDGDGVIRIKGSSSFSVYLNGKPYRMGTMNPKEVFQSIPANSISKVELITKLDASHDASTGDAIINIITERKGVDGYKILLNGNAETHPKTGTGITAIITKGKFDVSLSYDYRYTHESDQQIELERENTRPGESTSRLHVESIGNGDFRYHTGRGMVVYSMDSLNSLYADAHLLFTNIHSNVENRQIFETEKKQYTQSMELSDYSSGSSEFNLVYQNLYKKNKSERLTLGYRYAYNPDKRATEVLGYEYPGIFTGWDEDTEEYIHRNDKTNGGLNEHTLQLDYRLPLCKGHILRFGGKDVLRKSDAKPEYLVWKDGQWMEDDERTDIGRMNQTQNIASAYLSYNYKRGRLNLNVGGRIEYSHTQMDFKDKPENNFNSDLVDFIPRCNLSYNVSENSQLSAAFSSGVIRPSIWNLNPFREQLNDYQLKYGNPDLKSQKQYTGTLSYMTYSSKWFVSMDVNYSYTKDAIVEYPFRDEENPKLLVYTYGNIGDYRRIGTSLFLNYKPIRELSFSANGTLAENHSKSSTLHVNERELSYNASASCDASLSRGWLLGGRWSIFKQTPRIRTSYSSFQMYSFYVYKRFMDGNLSIGLTANQPFKEKYNSQTISTGDNFIQKKTNFIRARSFGITLSYSFGSGKVKNIKRNKKIQNVDLQQSTGVK